MKIEITSPVGVLLRSHRELDTKRLQPVNSKHDEIRDPSKKLEREIVRGHEKHISLETRQTHLKFETDENTGIRVIKIIDAESGEVVRQIPPEELVKITKTLRDLKGLFISKES